MGLCSQILLAPAEFLVSNQQTRTPPFPFHPLKKKNENTERESQKRAKHKGGGMLKKSIMKCAQVISSAQGSLW